ncbi:mannosyl-glycoprotein endo-beta-N-acetylglucosamidase [Limosilactobacillus coleohominis DSM 14060]|nr:mannosyl-glycoprotein endo-beta-N-acetylglucosamidase [Limosilactobacillus coleohominis DSM 14060]
MKVTNDYIPVHWSNGDTTWYMFDETGAIVTGLKEWYGSLYYFDPSTFVKVTNDVVYANGNVYWANETGALQKAANSNQAFLYSIKKAAQDGWRQYGVLPSVTAAQAIIESAWGRSGLATKGHNLFGIKGSYNGQSITMRTAEYGSGGYYYINDAFRKYPSNYESVVDHGRFLAENSRYRNLLWDTNYASVTAKLQRDGYATAPTYASTLNNTIRTYGLDSWDREVIG